MIYGTFINPKSPKGVATFEKDELKIEVVYHRPYKRDRLIFGAWRGNKCKEKVILVWLEFLALISSNH